MAIDSRVGVSPDGGGPGIRTLQLTMLINGVPTTVVMQQVISIADESGKLLDFGFAESLEAIERTGRRQLATLMLMLDVLKSGRDAPDRNDVYAMAEELLV